MRQRRVFPRTQSESMPRHPSQASWPQFLKMPTDELWDNVNIVKAAQHSVHLTGGYVPRFQAVCLTPATSVKMALSRPSRQQVTQTVGRQLPNKEEDEQYG